MRSSASFPTILGSISFKEFVWFSLTNCPAEHRNKSFKLNWIGFYWISLPMVLYGFNFVRNESYSSIIQPIDSYIRIKICSKQTTTISFLNLFPCVLLGWVVSECIWCMIYSLRACLPRRHICYCCYVGARVCLNWVRGLVESKYSCGILMFYALNILSFVWCIAR